MFGGEAGFLVGDFLLLEFSRHLKVVDDEHDLRGDHDGDALQREAVQERLQDRGDDGQHEVRDQCVVDAFRHPAAVLVQHGEADGHADERQHLREDVVRAAMVDVVGVEIVVHVVELRDDHQRNRHGGGGEGRV